MANHVSTLFLVKDIFLYRVYQKIYHSDNKLLRIRDRNFTINNDIPFRSNYFSYYSEFYPILFGYLIQRLGQIHCTIIDFGLKHLMSVNQHFQNLFSTIMTAYIAPYIYLMFYCL